MDDFRDFIDYITDVETDEVRGSDQERMCEEEQNPEERGDFRGKISDAIAKIRESGDEHAHHKMKELVGRFVDDLRSLLDDSDSDKDDKHFE